LYFLPCMVPCNTLFLHLTVSYIHISEHGAANGNVTSMIPMQWYWRVNQALGLSTADEQFRCDLLVKSWLHMMAYISTVLLISSIYSSPNFFSVSKLGCFGWAVLPSFSLSLSVPNCKWQNLASTSPLSVQVWGDWLQQLVFVELAIG